MSYNPYARYRYGGELYHGRTKGSKNGVSNTPGYRAVGKKATGRIVGYRNGTPIYEYTNIAAIREERNKTINDTKRRGRLNVAKAKVAFDKKKFQEQNASRPKTDVREIQRQALINKRNYDRSLIGRIDNATKGARKAVGGTVSRAAGNVGNWLRGRANDVGKAARSAGNAIYNRAGRLWDGAAGKGTGADRAKGFKGAAASQYQRDYDRSIVGTANRVGNWLNDRRRDVGNAARNAGRAIDRAWDGREGRGDARDTAYEYDLQGRETDAARSREAYNRSIKGRLENLPGNIGRAVSGAARNAAGAVGGAANRARRAVEEAWDGKAGKGSAKDDAYEYFRQGEDGTDQEGFREMDRYNRSIKGRLENAGKAVNKAARGASKYVSDRAEDVGKAARGAARSVSGAVGGAANRVRRAAEEAWDGKAGKGTARDMAENFNGPAKNEYNRKYDRSIKGTAERVGKAISGAAKSVSDKASRRMKEAGEFVSTTAKNASSAIDTATKPTREKINKALSNKDEKERMVYLGSFYDADTGHWQSEEAKQNYEKAVRDYERHLITQAGKVSKQAKQKVTQILDDAKSVGSDAIGKISSVYSSVESYINRLTKGKK